MPSKTPVVALMRQPDARGIILAVTPGNDIALVGATVVAGLCDARPARASCACAGWRGSAAEPPNVCAWSLYRDRLTITGTPGRPCIGWPAFAWTRSS